MIDALQNGLGLAVDGEAAPAVRRPAVGDLDRPPLDDDSECEIRFAVLVGRYGDMLRCFLLSLTRQMEVAEDLSQQLWLKLLEAVRCGRFRPQDDASVRSYLFAAARNLFVDECLRKHAASRTAACDPQSMEVLMHGQAIHAESPEDDCDRDRMQHMLHRAIEQLPAPQRTVIRLWMSGASIESMVRETGAPRDTVLSRKKYAFRRLRATLGEQGA